MNGNSAWKAFIKAEKLFLHTENLQKLETNSSGELGVHQQQSSGCTNHRTKLLTQPVPQNAFKI